MRARSTLDWSQSNISSSSILTALQKHSAKIVHFSCQKSVVSNNDLHCLRECPNQGRYCVRGPRPECFIALFYEDEMLQ